MELKKELKMFWESVVNLTWFITLYLIETTGPTQRTDKKNET